MYVYYCVWYARHKFYEILWPNMTIDQNWSKMFLPHFRWIVLLLNIFLHKDTMIKYFSTRINISLPFFCTATQKIMSIVIFILNFHSEKSL